jgi:hypothetical protein
VPGQLGGLEPRHRQHARVEDRIRQAKASGLRNLPCDRSEPNTAWLEIIMAATDLVAWTKLIGFTGQPDLATCDIGTFRYRVLQVAARITRGARQIRLRIDTTWRWATPSPKDGNNFEPPSPNKLVTVHARPERPPGPRKARHRATPADLSHPPATISPPSRPAPTSSARNPAARKIEARVGC